ncbi:MAG: DegV family protein [Ruminococcaceae bacterium]|nr:DegV family protein [Oscillospiraceae bacterium]
MNKNVVLLAETGSDITPEIAAKYGIYIVPMHVQLGNITKDDGTFPPEEVCEYYEKTGEVPKTSGSTPEDFEIILNRIHAEHPDKHIFYLAYSAVTTCSYHSCCIASEERDYVTCFDTKQVSVGQAAFVIEVAEYLNANPDAAIEQAVAFAQSLMSKVHMAFIPENLDYLRAGGRVSNVAAIIGNLIGLHPCIEIEDGYLLAKKKYRGSFTRVLPQLIKEHSEKFNLCKDKIYFIWTPGFSDELKEIVDNTAKELGYRQIIWMKTGCVITCHGGKGAFGVVGFN